MPIDMPKYMEFMRVFLANRAAFPASELAKHCGHWVAFSPDGSRIAASSVDPEQLDALLRKQGYDPMDCVIEGIPDEEITFNQTDESAA
jgi:hypothetical protein